MLSSKDIVFSIQTLDEPLPLMQDDLAENFRGVATCHIEYLMRKEPNTTWANPKMRYVLFALDQHVAVSYLYFWLEEDHVVIFGVLPQ